MAIAPERQRYDRLLRIEKALDAGYRHRPSEMLSWLLSTLLKKWGLPEWQPVPDDALGQISDALAAYDAAVAESEPFEDLLGPVYMNIAGRGQKNGMGQFFTPWTIATFMAQITLGDSPSSLGGQLLTACDPCSGSGVMMLALCNQIFRSGGSDALRRWSVTCCDLDAICARMSAVQLVANCNAHAVELGEIVVLNGNSLLPWKGMELVVHASARNLTPAPGPALAPGRMASLAAAAGAHPDAREQLSLFDFEEAA